MLPAAYNDPSTEILELNADLISFDSEISTYLPPQQQVFIKSNLGSFVDAIVLALSFKLTSMNAHGRDRMALNLLVLLQNLKALAPGAALDRSSAYYEMFGDGPEKIVERARKKDFAGFDYDQLKGLIELSFSEGIQSERRDVSVAAKRTCDDLVLQLSEFMWA